MKLPRKLTYHIGIMSALAAMSSALSYALIAPAQIHLSETKKNKSYISDGLILGGDRTVDEVSIKDIRHASNLGFERIVIDLDSTRGSEKKVQRPPYYQVSINPEEKRLVFTLWGKAKLDFDPKKVMSSFKQSSMIQNIMLLPTLEDDSWTFAIVMKSTSPVEVFELTHPVRLILDFQKKKDS